MQLPLLLPLTCQRNMSCSASSISSGSCCHHPSWRELGHQHLLWHLPAAAAAAAAKGSTSPRLYHSDSKSSGEGGRHADGEQQAHACRVSAGVSRTVARCAYCTICAVLAGSLQPLPAAHGNCAAWTYQLCQAPRVAIAVASRTATLTAAAGAGR